MRASLLFGALCGAAGCIAEPDPLPTEVLVAGADARMDRAEEPPLYQLLYDYAFLPEVQAAEQRVRILIWLRHMDFSSFQLKLLADLHHRGQSELARIEAAQAGIVASYEPQLVATYDALWDGLTSGRALDDPELERAAQALLTQKLQFAREKELFALRAQGVAALLAAQQELLDTLTPRQEALLTDASFFLRHRLDPYANAGDFRTLIGSIYVAGEWGTLQKGSWDRDKYRLNLAALWTDQAIEDLQGPVFNQHRRALVLYMILLEPQVPEAVQGALAAAQGTPSGAQGGEQGP